MQRVSLTTGQIANYLKIDKFTVYSLVAQKRLPTFKVVNQWCFNKEPLETILRKNMSISKSNYWKIK